MLQVTERTPSARRNRRPRTRAKRILAAAGGFAIVLGLLGTLAVYTGTPLGDWLARRSAVEYADQTYPGYGFEVEWISNRHWLCYEVGLRARNSEDTRFAVELARGRVVSDNFDENGYGGAWDRICELLYADVTSRLAGDPLLGQAAVRLWHA